MAELEIPEEYNTATKKKLFLEVLATSRGIITLVTDKTNIGRSTYYHWKKTDLEFKRSVNEILKSRIEHIEDKLLMKALEGDDTRAMIYMVERLSKKKTNKKESVSHVFHHVDKKDIKDNSVTLEDLMYQHAERKKLEEERNINTS